MCVYNFRLALFAVFFSFVHILCASYTEFYVRSFIFRLLFSPVDLHLHLHVSHVFKYTQYTCSICELCHCFRVVRLLLCVRYTLTNSLSHSLARLLIQRNAMSRNNCRFFFPFLITIIVSNKLASITVITIIFHELWCAIASMHGTSTMNE